MCIEAMPAFSRSKSQVPGSWASESNGNENSMGKWKWKNRKFLCFIVFCLLDGRWKEEEKKRKMFGYTFFFLD